MKMLNESDLHDYQRYGADFIVNNPLAYLALDCGLGKTVTTLTAIAELINRREVSKVLVICPLRVGAVWRDEINKWRHLYDLRCSVAIGSAAERLAAFRRQADIYVLNRENVHWFVEESGLYSSGKDGKSGRANGKISFDMLVVDESSSFKDHTTVRFRAIMKIRPKVKRCVLLSATPAANGLEHLWAQFRLIDKGERLGRFIGPFRKDYFLPDKRRGEQVYSWKIRDEQAESDIYGLIDDITISMKATDYLDMPELITVEHAVELEDKERKIYDRLKRDMFVDINGGEIDAVNAAALCGKLCQLANGAVYDDGGKTYRVHNRKLDKLEDLIEAANGNSVLIAYWFKHDLERISAKLKRMGVKFEKLDTQDSINKWNAGELQAALIHPASAGHGLNLQAGGSMIIWFGITWSLELYQQTNARLWRQGQTAASVVVHHIVAKNTIDERIVRSLKDKDLTQSALIEAVRACL